MRITSVFFGSVLLLSAMFYSPQLLAETGKTTVTGQVVSSACALHPESHEQYLVTDSISVGHLIRHGSSDAHPFDIRLINCLIQEKNKESAFQITFEAGSDSYYFPLQGSSRGIVIEIQDDRGYTARPGIPMAPHPILSDNKTLKYSLRLVGNGELLEFGDHFASIKYKLDYY
ncbi:fimbrial protein [Enterobacter cloacae]|uniref:fimbrial protein n=1 Tax=Enterobacter cloacae TaxID=550 RepID=UPI00101B1B04|nr:fimbrial protein [Enterobacter cloacae]QBC03389.1 type 1 fimbrial protein [Enterobacter cloacae]